MKTSDFDYYLPKHLIAQKPVEPRDTSRLLILRRAIGKTEHRRFRDILQYLHPGDVLVANDSRVIPARLFGHKHHSGGKFEVLLTHKRGDKLWEAMVRGHGLREGALLQFNDGSHHLAAKVVEVTPQGRRVLAFSAPVEPHLAHHGVVPLPPYVHEPLSDVERYQTVYARSDGSVAAPTAGLHFTANLLAQIKQKGIEIAFITLHIGTGTFQPVNTVDVEKHQLEAEHFSLSSLTAETINRAKAEKRRVVAIGTTVVRVLEAQGRSGVVNPGRGWTDFFIYPGFEFKIIDALITNFHLPRSTLLMLVSAFAGKDNIERAYAEAIVQKYRFYSFGDAMFIC